MILLRNVDYLECILLCLVFIHTKLYPYLGMDLIKTREVSFLVLHRFTESIKCTKSMRKVAFNCIYSSGIYNKRH